MSEDSRPSLLVVVQRYGDVAGGAETHARMLVGQLRHHLRVEVATTTAKDYRTWKNEYPAGVDSVDGVTVRRFPVARPRARDLRRHERAAFRRRHTLAQERAFIEAQGPLVPELLDHVSRHGRDFDHVLFFTYMYYPTAYGLPLVPERAVLVPTAHDEPAIELTSYRAVFHAARAIAFNSEEERAMVQRRFVNRRIPSDVVGVGVDVPKDRDPERFRWRHRIETPFLLYIGRIVQSKGCAELFDLWGRWKDAAPRDDTVLALIGHREMAIPQRNDIRYIGQVRDQEKFDALAACAGFVMPSRFESLSIATLEAWAVGRPAIVPARSPMLQPMVHRAGAGMAYRSAEEFAVIAALLAHDPALADRLGACGGQFVQRTYTWPVVVEKYLDLFAEVRARNG
jgi:glycosyltransferase involved in cell wall biosynthesis